jgi:hypothetical protein
MAGIAADDFAFIVKATDDLVPFAPEDRHSRPQRVRYLPTTGTGRTSLDELGISPLKDIKLLQLAKTDMAQLAAEILKVTGGAPDRPET